MQKDKFSLSSAFSFFPVISAGEFLLIITFLVNPLEGGASELEDETDAPSMELLEFLAEFETEDGRWVGPSVLESMIETGWSGQALEAAKDE